MSSRTFTVLKFVTIILIALMYHQTTIAADDWITVAPMPTPRSETVATTLDGKIYVAGGLVGTTSGARFGALNTFEMYDPSTNEWAERAPIPVENGLHHLTIAAANDRIYVTGGYDGSDFNTDVTTTWVYDPEIDVWSQAAAMPAPRAAHAMVTINDQLYIVGGEGPRSNEVWVYDPPTDSWETITTLPTQREHLSAATIDDRLFVIGGRWHNQGNLATLEVYDPETAEWTQLADMPTPRGGITAAVINGKLHVTGGEDLKSPQTFSAHEAYNPQTDTWESLADLPTPRHGLASAVVEDQWYVIGGATGAGPQTTSTLQNIVEVFTTESNP